MVVGWHDQLMDILLWMQLLALPATAVFVLVAPVVAMAKLGRRPKAAVGLWAGGLLLLGIWVTTTMQAAVRADETGGRGDVFGTVEWLVLAGISGALSLAVVLRSGRHNGAGRSASPAVSP